MGLKKSERQQLKVEFDKALQLVKPLPYLKYNEFKAFMRGYDAVKSWVVQGVANKRLYELGLVQENFDVKDKELVCYTELGRNLVQEIMESSVVTFKVNTT